METGTALALLLAEVGLLLLGALAARAALARALPPDDVPRVLVHRVAVIDQRHRQLVAAALTLCALGLVLLVVV